MTDPPLTDARPTILAVEDEPLNLRLVKAVLEPAGYEVVEAPTLRDARAWLAVRLPDLVLLDLRLPDGDGLTLARELRERRDAVDLPIVAATANAMPEVPAAVRAAGCDALLVKPISPARLLGEVRDQLAAARPADDDDQALGDAR